MRLKMNVLALAAVLMLAAGMSAQSSDVTYMMDTPPNGQGPAANIKITYDTDNAPVKGAPFCATVVTEHTQNLSDGNRIHSSESSQLCRDSQGRTRRGADLNLLGAAPQAPTPSMITITDPVAGFRYLLDTGSKTAQKMPIGADKFFVTSDASGGDSAKGKHTMIVESSGTPEAGVMVRKMTVNRSGDDASGSPSTENLGDQTIEGVRARGTRMTTVIPAGKMDNEKPITVTSERWYSPELKVDVKTTHDDPWSGELKTELKNVSTAEPDATLFAVPADYKVIDDKEGPVVYKLNGPSAPAQ